MSHSNEPAVIRLEHVKIDGGTQSRAALNEAVVADYAEHVDSLPPVTVFFDGAAHWLADGFHRYFAHQRAGKPTIRAIVERGSKRDAVRHSLSANHAHGLRRSNDDKRRAVLTALADAEWSTWTDNALAKLCAVSHPFVAAVRNPATAERQQEHREASARRKVESDSTLPPVAKPVAVSAAPTSAPEKINTPVPAASFPVEKPEPQDDDGPTLAEMAALAAELQAENERLAAEVKVAKAADPIAEALRWKRLYDNAVRQQSEAMDRAKQSVDREKWTKRQLMRCGKAVGEDDPTKIAPRVEAMARERRAA